LSVLNEIYHSDLALAIAADKNFGKKSGRQSRAIKHGCGPGAVVLEVEAWMEDCRDRGAGTAD